MTNLSEEILSRMARRGSTRKFKPIMPDKETIHKLIEVGTRAPTVAQLYSIIVSTKGEHPYNAPMSLVICVDKNRMMNVLAQKGGQIKVNDLSYLQLATQDAACMAAYLSLAAEIMGLGTCMIGACSMKPERIKFLVEKHALAHLVLPILELVLGYPADTRKQTPRLKIDEIAFENEYPNISNEQTKSLIERMDQEYARVGYYKDLKTANKKRIDDNTEDTWSEHMKKKWGQDTFPIEEFIQIYDNQGFVI